LQIEIMIQSPKWKAKPRAPAAIRKAIRAAASATSTPDAELAIVLTNDSAIHALNRDWRGHDAPTNVLSFPAVQAPARKPRALRGRPVAPTPLGDIVIAYETMAREAKTEAKPFEHHLIHLAVHGFLHLLGYDHETGRDAKTMETLETDILAAIGVPDPYAVRPGRP